MTNSIQIYIDIADCLELCRMLDSGELHAAVHEQNRANGHDPIREWLGGTSAKKLARLGKSRSDGKSLSRTAQIYAGSRIGTILFVASSGPGEENATGLIVPRFGKNPEQHVAVNMNFDGVSQLLLLTRIHYNSWLTAWCMREDLARSSEAMEKRPNKSPPKEGHEAVLFPDLLPSPGKNHMSLAMF